MTEGLSNQDIPIINHVLQHAIQYDLVKDVSLHQLIIALDYFRDQLPFFVQVQINLINQLNLFTNILELQYGDYKQVNSVNAANFDGILPNHTKSIQEPDIDNFYTNFINDDIYKKTELNKELSSSDL